MIKNYIYLAGRSKKGIKVLAVLKGENQPATRLSDVTKLGLPSDLLQKITKKIHEDRMLWEPWIASAADYVELKEILRNKGYSDLPMNASPLFDVSLKSVIRNKSDFNEVVVKAVQKPSPTMLRKFKP